MVDRAPCGESKACDVSLSAVWSSSGGPQRAYADRAGRGYAAPPACPHRVRARGAPAWSAASARGLAADPAARGVLLAIAPATAIAREPEAHRDAVARRVGHAWRQRGGALEATGSLGQYLL